MCYVLFSEQKSGRRRVRAGSPTLAIQLLANAQRRRSLYNAGARDYTCPTRAYGAFIRPLLGKRRAAAESNTLAQKLNDNAWPLLPVLTHSGAATHKKHCQTQNV